MNREQWLQLVNKAIDTVDPNNAHYWDGFEPNTENYPEILSLAQAHVSTNTSRKESE